MILIKINNKLSDVSSIKLQSVSYRESESEIIFKAIIFLFKHEIF